jgi:hypothetical protein
VQFTGKGAAFAPGQTDYPCTGTGVSPCPAFDVHVWAIPSIGIPSIQGCVASFPYAALKVPRNPTQQPPVDTVVLIWNLVVPPVVGFDFQFDPNGGVEVTNINDKFMGKFADVKRAMVTTANQVKLTLRGPQLQPLFFGNHLPRVQYRPQTPPASAWSNCIPVDPVITNND